MSGKAQKALCMFLSILIITSILCGCGTKNENAISTADSVISYKPDTTVDSFETLSDPRLPGYMESVVYSEILNNIDSEKYVIEDVQAIYLSKELIEESIYNSKSNVYFGYTLDELNEYFSGKKYVFTLGDNGETTVKEFENYDDTYDKMLQNVAIGSGVILVCVVLTVVTEGAGAPAAAAIFATSAKTGAIAAASGALIGGTASGIMTGIETNDFRESLKAAALGGSEGYKWGAITGAVSGGMSEFVALHGATANGLTMNQVAQIQKETKYPLDVIKNLNSMEQYNILKEGGLTSYMINGKTALIRDIDLNFVDEMGRTNLARMQQGLAPLDPTGVPYELHHVGQKTNSTLAILTKAEHRLGDNHKIWHPIENITENPSTGAKWTITRKEFWQAFAKTVGG